MGAVAYRVYKRPESKGISACPKDYRENPWILRQMLIRSLMQNKVTVRSTKHRTASAKLPVSHMVGTILSQ